MTTRRNFIGMSVLATSFLGLQKAFGVKENLLCEGYGALQKDLAGIFDLPKGFHYEVISRTGETMSDGFRVPGAPDGMAAFSGENGRVIIVRNHELGADQAKDLGPLPNHLSCPDGISCYDAGGETEAVMPGGTTNLVYDPKTKKVEREFLSSLGTDRNCAGGPTPWGTWVTCEEPISLIGPRRAKHGWCFEVSATEEGVQKIVPLKDMGRFRHEAVAVDPKTGIVYLTEDRHEGLFYRFIPNVKGKLAAGGRLEALVIEGGVSDSRNWSGSSLNPQQAYQVKWIPLEEVDAPKDDLRFRGAKAGATVFARGEGCWWGEGEVWFCCTNGGPEKRGQLFKYRPESESASGHLELFVQPQHSDLLTNGDNLTIAPNGDVIIAEDRGDDQCSLRGVTSEGKIYTLGTNRLNSSELAGVCFSPDGQTLFVNIQFPGITLAIHGDWNHRQG